MGYLRIFLRAVFAAAVFTIFFATSAFGPFTGSVSACETVNTYRDKKKEETRCLSGRGLLYSDPAEIYTGKNAFFNRLSDKEKKATADIVRKLISENDEEMIVKKEDKRSVSAARDILLPYFGDINIESDGEYIKISMSDPGLIPVNRKIKELAHSLLVESGIEEGSDDEKIRKISDIVCRYLTYDKKYAGKYMDSFLSSMKIRRGACLQYSELFYILCCEEGIPCEIVWGGSSGGYHAWNRVYDGEKWKYIDVTWNDSKDSGGRYQLSEELWEDHWDPAVFEMRESVRGGQ